MPLTGCRILVVEDEWIIADHVTHVLEEAGATVVGPYTNVVDSLEHLCDLDAIDGAVVDVNLGTDDSYPLAEALKTTTLPFLFLTGREREELPERFARVPHMLKPMNPRRLVQMLVEAGVARAA